MALIDCSECGKQVSDKAAACPSCGNPIAVAVHAGPVAPPQVEERSWEVVEFTQAYAPEIFVSCLLVFLYGFGLVFLFFIWITKKSNRLILAEQSVIQKDGIFTQKVSEVQYRDIRNIQISRAMGGSFGRLSVSSAGQADFEIDFNRCKDPEAIKEMLNERRDV
jgi:hypothetical protein